MARGILLSVTVIGLLFLGQAALAQPGMMPQPMSSPGMQPPGPESAMMGQGMMPHMGPGMGQPMMHHQPGRGGMQPGFFLRFRAELGLTDDQVSRLTALRSEYLKQTIRRDADIKIARLELRELLAEETWNLPQAEEKIRQISALTTQTRLERLHALARGRDILTAEQRKKLKELRDWRRR